MHVCCRMHRMKDRCVFVNVIATVSQWSVITWGNPLVIHPHLHSCATLYRDPELPVGSCPRIVASLKQWLPDVVGHLPSAELRSKSLRHCLLVCVSVCVCVCVCVCTCSCDHFFPSFVLIRRLCGKVYQRVQAAEPW